MTATGAVGFITPLLISGAVTLPGMTATGAVELVDQDAENVFSLFDFDNVDNRTPGVAWLALTDPGNISRR